MHMQSLLYYTRSYVNVLHYCSQQIDFIAIYILLNSSKKQWLWDQKYQNRLNHNVNNININYKCQPVSIIIFDVIC